MTPTRIATPADWPTREFALPTTRVDWPPVVVPSRAARHHARTRRADARRLRFAVGAGLAYLVALISIALYVGGWSG